MVTIKKILPGILLFAFLVAGLFNTTMRSVQAEGGSTPQVIPPRVLSFATFFGPNQNDYTLSTAALQQLNEKIQLAQNHWNQTHSSGIKPNVSLGAKQLSVGASGAYREPNDSNHVNYCGPSSSQVAIKAHGGTVPNLEVIATQEYVAPNDTAVWIGYTRPVLNADLSTTWYIVGSSSSQAQFGTWLETDIDNNYSMLTALYTQGISGWSTYANHIVATYGYTDTGGSVTVNYVDTASNAAGYYGSYFNSPSLSQFYGYVQANGNNVQVW